MDKKIQKIMCSQGTPRSKYAPWSILQQEKNKTPRSKKITPWSKKISAVHV